MWALGVIAGLLVVAVVARYLLGRDNVPPMERHLRALEALRDLSEQPRPTIDLTPPPDLVATDHVRILEGAPTGTRPARRAASKRPAAGARTRRTTKARSAALANAELPTIQIRPALSALSVDPPRPRPPAPVASPPPSKAPITGPFGSDDLPPLSESPPARPSEPAPFIPAHTPAPGPGPAPAGARRTARSLLDSVPPRAFAATAALATVALAVGIVIAAGLTNHHATNTAAKTTHPATAPARVAVAPTTTSTPPTTVAPNPATVLTRSTTGATVSVHTPFQLTLHANGTCWVEITDATGHTLYMATLHSGQEQQIPGAGSIVVRLGYTPAVTISVDGVTLDLSGLSQTANVNFQSA